MQRFLLALAAVVLFVLPVAAAEPVTVKVIPSRVEAVIEHEGDFAGLGPRYGQILQWATRHGWSSVGPTVAVFLTDVSRPVEQRRSEARIPLNIYGTVLPRVPGGSAGVRLRRQPAHMVIATRHVGPYAQILPAYQRLREQLAARRLRATGPMYEVYLSDPAQMPPEKLETEVRLQVEPTGTVEVGIYVGPGGYPAGVQAASLCFTSHGLTVRPVRAADIQDGSFARQIRSLYMPGGWAAHYVRDIQASGAEQLRSFIDGGGGYMGVCAGAFFAAGKIQWAGESVDYPLDLFPGTPAGPLTKIARWPGYAMTPVKMSGKHPISRKHRGKRQMLYYGGPTLTPRKGADVAVLGVYSATGDAAIVAFEHGKGRVFLSSAHIDYDLMSTRDDSPWPEDEKGIDDRESDWDILQAAAVWVLGDRK